MGIVPDSESKILNRLAKESRDPLERERLRALYVLSIGESVSKVAIFFSVDVDTVYRWAERWNSEKSVADLERSGRPPSLGEKEKKEIKRLVDENDPGKHGNNSSTWTCTELRLYFQLKGIAVSEENIRRCLREMGVHYVKATLEYAETYSDDVVREREEFARQFMKEMKAKPDDAVVLFEDEMSVDRSHNGGYGWTFGKRLTLRTPQRMYEKRINGFGAVNPLRGRVFRMNTMEAKSESLIRFIERLLNRNRGKRLWIYLDNPPVHRSKVLKKWIAGHPRVVLKPLPRYSPDINPQEQWWNYERAKLLNNRYFGSNRKLDGAVMRFVRNTSPATVKSVCNISAIEHLLK
ncbi:MAG: IS630 family transposase [Nitrososphaerota archaeon]|nr:IS630 family transposase [Nitrososphaerota archaeon]